MAPERLLYHVTDEAYLDHILEDGLKTGKDAALSADGLSDKKTRQTRTRLGKTRTVDQLVERFRPASLSACIPNRTDSLYYWTTAHRAAAYAGTNQSVLAIDATAIPCDGAVGNGSYLQSISNAIFPRLHTDPLFPELVNESGEYSALAEDVPIPAPVRERAEAFWETVQPYNGQSNGTIEAWFACDVPPDAIVAVDPEVEEPPTAGDIGIIDVPNTGDVEAKARELFDRAARGEFSTGSVNRVLVTGQFGSGTVANTPSHLTVVLDIDDVEIPSDFGSTVDGLNDTERYSELLSHQIIQDHHDWFSGATVELAYRGEDAAAQAVLSNADLTNPEGTIGFDLTAGEPLMLDDLVADVPEDVFAQIAYNQFQDKERTTAFVEEYYGDENQ